MGLLVFRIVGGGAGRDEGRDRAGGTTRCLATATRRAATGGGERLRIFLDTGGGDRLRLTLDTVFELRTFSEREGAPRALLRAGGTTRGRSAPPRYCLPPSPPREDLCCWEDDDGPAPPPPEDEPAPPRWCSRSPRSRTE